MKPEKSKREEYEVSMRKKPIKTRHTRGWIAKISLMLAFTLAIFLHQGWMGTNTAQAATQTQYPTADNSATGTWTITGAAARWDAVNETTADDATTSINGTATGNALFNFTAFTVPAGSTIADLTIYYRHYKAAAQACNIRSSIRVNGTNYDTTDAGVNPTNGTWTTSSYAFTTNPNTGAAWNVADINGTGTNPLQAFGVYASDISPTPYVTQVYAVVTYTIPDTTPPTTSGLTFDSPVSGAYVGSPFTFHGDLTDNESNVTSCQYCVKNGSECTSTDTWATGTLSGSSPLWTCTANNISTYTNAGAITSGDAVYIDVRGTSTGGRNDNGGTAITKTMDKVGPASGASFTTTPGNTTCTLNWAATTDAGSGMNATQPYEIRWQLGSDPGSCTGGAQLYIGTALTTPHNGLTNGSTYYYRLCYKDVFNYQSQYTGNPVTCIPVTGPPTLNPDDIPAGTWTNEAGGALTPDRISDVSDLTYARTLTNGATFDAGFSNDAAYAGKQIDNVRIYVRAYSAGEKLDWGPVIGGTPYLSGTQVTLTTTPTDYFKDWATNPATSTNWTPAEVDALVARMSAVATGGMSEERVYKVWAVITYSEPPSSGALLHNSATTGSTKWAPTGWGIAGGRYDEFTCETCHIDATGSIKMIKDAVITAPNSPTNQFPAEIGGTAPVYSRVVGATGQVGVMGDDSLTPRASSNKICEICHTYDATKANGVNAHPYSVGSALPNHQGSDAADCTGCHKHNQGFKAPACDTCHGDPPGALASSPYTTGSTTAGAHTTHVTTLSFGCSNCHGASYSMPEASTAKPGYGDIDISFSNFGSTTGTYSGQSNVSYNNTLGTGTKTCSTVYCHGSTIGGPVTAAVWDNTTGSPYSCASTPNGACHNASATNPPTLAAHQRHAASGTYGAGKQGLNVVCSDCHGTTASGHVNGDVSWALNTASNKFSATAYYKTGPSNSGSTGGLAPSASYSSCYNIYCHSTVTGDGGVAGTYVASPAWNGTTTCANCHRDQTATYTGKHQTHATTYGYVCATCHSGAGSETTKHADRNVDVVFSGIASGGSYSGSSTPGDAYGNCTSSYCHSQGTSIASPPAPNVVAAWGGSMDLTCSGCHGGNSTATTKITSNAHGAHTNDTGNKVGFNISCAECHSATVTADRTLNGTQYHVNQTLNVRFDNGTRVKDSPDAPTYNSQSAQSTVAGGATAAPGAQASCVKVYCHSIGNLDGSNNPVTPASDFKTLAWNTATIDCTGCHGISGTKAHPDYATGGGGTTTANSHVKHVENSYYGCDYCHNTTTLDTNIYPLLPASVIPSGSGGLHLNRVENVSFKTIGGKSGTYNGAVTFKTCSTTYCHGSGTPQWGGTSLTCAQCHSDMGAGTGAHLYQGAHSQHTNSTAYLFDCENCHDSTQRTHAGGNADGTAPVQAAEMKFEASGTAGTWLTNQYNGGGSTFKYTRITQEPYSLGAVTPAFTKGVAAGATSPDPTGSFAWTKSTCTNVWCHSTALRIGIAGIVYRTTPAWDATITTCTVCHRATGDTYATMTNVATTDRMSQGHAQHIASDKYVQNTNFTCNACHSTTASNNTTISSYTLHVNGAKNVSFNAYAGTAPTWDNVGYTCGNTYCHSNGTGGTSNTGDTRGIAVNTSLAWNGTTTCASCHGNPPSYTNGTPKANSHTAHSSYTCDKCHYATTTTGNTITGFTTHVNKLYNLSNSGATLTYTYALGGGNCTIAACHGAGNPTWGGPSLKCSDCHLSTAADLNNYTYGDNTAANINSTQWSYSGHGKTTGSYDVTLNPAANLPGSTATGDPCQYCHDSTVGHGDTTNAFRLRNFADVTFGKNGTCMKCHGTGQTGVDPDGAGTVYNNKTATVKIDKYHYDTTNGKHSATLNGGQFCWDCHDPHGDSTSTAGPIAMIQLNPAQASDAITGEPTTVTATAVVFSSDTAPLNFGNSTGNGICNVCHTYKAADPNKMVHYYNTTPFTDSHNSTTICTNCHKHSANATYDEKAWAGAGACTDCHSSIKGARRAAANDFTTYTSRHVFGGTVTNFDCIVCHSEGDNTSSGTTIKTIASLHGGDSETAPTKVHLRNVDSDGSTKNPGTLGTDYWAWPSSGRTNADYENMDKFCLGCHDANGASGIDVNSGGTGLELGTGTARDLTPFNNTDGLGAAGRATGSVYSTTYNRTRVTDIKSKVSDNTYYAWHAIGVTGYPKPYATINAGWVIGAWVTNTLKNGTQLTTVRETATLHCADCHTVDTNAHGGANAFMLIGATVDATCALCHNTTTTYSGTATAEGNSRFMHKSYDSNVWGVPSSFGGDCRNCHGGDPSKAYGAYGEIHGRKQVDQRNGAATNSYRFVGGAYMTYVPSSWTAATASGTCYFNSKTEPFSSCAHHALGTSTTSKGTGYARGTPGQY